MSYDEMQLDVLKEVMNIGGGNAATSISSMVNKTIDMKVPDVNILSYQELYDQIIHEDEEVYAIVSKIIGEVQGVFLFVLGNDSASKMTEFMLGEQTDNPEIQQSALNELTNIIANSFLGAIGKLIDRQLFAALPVVQYDYFGAIISSMYMALDQYDDNIMIIRNEFFYDQEKLDASLFFIPHQGGIEKIFEALGI
ncbi:chemotaxis protein CheC [Enterococcus cecorum]|uniref:chemotaxis protein CheC n=1 Tax=Enterococcus cecorum TaxID=44008 RepID=UPI00200B38A3|nr:chemotaxis protein CheC [Enterococcus cecorum]